jgi:hypothetical protein
VDVNLTVTERQAFPVFYEQVRDHPVFVILGVQGSGTNLLRSMLVPAFRFSVVQDQSLVFNAAARLGRSPTANQSRREFQQLLRHLLPSTMTRKTRRIVKSNGSFAGIEQYFEAHGIRSAADFALFIYAYSAYSLDTLRMAVKSDDMWEHIDQMDEVIPNRRVILLTRDFRDNLLSITNKDFGPVEPLVSARYVAHRFARYEHEYLRTPEAHRLHVRYEDLLAAPQEFVVRFSQHFGLSLAPNGQEGVDRLKIRANNVKKWLSIDRETLDGCQGILREPLLRYGYEKHLEAEPPDALTWTMARARDVVLRVPQKISKLSRRLQK